uniref:HAT C-terminal dimerisation domain-containing protein n=1 Tax=Ditylenchus dipsaci TaxID=166011 RepID=A0A915DLQ0_9BILA
MNRALSASSPGMDALNYRVKIINTVALEVLFIPVTSAPIERVFSQAALATACHRNKTSFELSHHHLVVYCNLYLENV